MAERTRAETNRRGRACTAACSGSTTGQSRDAASRNSYRLYDPACEQQRPARRCPAGGPHRLVRDPLVGNALIVAASAMDCYVYVLGTIAKNRHLTYVGWTNDVSRRLVTHNAGKGARSTRGRSWVLLYSERCASKRHAMSREWHLKRNRALRRELAMKQFGG